jgi:hypothetical protein
MITVTHDSAGNDDDAALRGLGKNRWGQASFFQGLVRDRAAEQDIMEIASINSSGEVLKSVQIPKLWECSRQRMGRLLTCLI